MSMLTQNALGKGETSYSPRIIDEDILSRLYGTPQAPSFKCWNEVRVIEKTSELLTVQAGSCNVYFPFFKYMQAHQIHLETSVNSEKNHASHLLARVIPGAEVNCNVGENKTRASKVVEEMQNGTFFFHYKGTEFRLHLFTYQQPFGPKERLLIFAWNGKRKLSGTHSPGEMLVLDVHEWASKLKDELWVYNGHCGGWRKDKEFYAAVHDAKSDDLIFDQNVLDSLQQNTTTFFDCRTLYEKFHIPWKRGILLLGPPGNGKTSALKHLAKRCAEKNIRTLYVQSAEAEGSSEYGIMQIFEKAREEAPCMLILEDIETLVTGETRTFLLNQLDGIESNTGVLVIGTANDASLLDPAILNRPSRFDTKYHFGLPDAKLRSRYITHWLDQKIGSALVVSDQDNFSVPLQDRKDAFVHQLVAKTEGWSFAFLKELFISVLLSRAAQMAELEKFSQIQEISISYEDCIKQAENLSRQVQHTENDKREE